MFAIILLLEKNLFIEISLRILFPFPDWKKCFFNSTQHIDFYYSSLIRVIYVLFAHRWYPVYRREQCCKTRDGSVCWWHARLFPSLVAQWREGAKHIHSTSRHNSYWVLISTKTLKVCNQAKLKLNFLICQVQTHW